MLTRRTNNIRIRIRFTTLRLCFVTFSDLYYNFVLRETNLVDICDQLEETFSAQLPGMQNFCSARYTAIRAALFRLCPAR
jgi:hypothetical protein